MRGLTIEPRLQYFFNQFGVERPVQVLGSILYHIVFPFVDAQ
jgi:hypothetical protein